MLSPADVAAVMDDTGLWWAVAGGWAIDLWLGAQTRAHHDIEVILYRSEQSRLHEALDRAWELHCIDPPGSGWRPWNGAPIEQPSFQLQARSERGEFDVFVETIVDSRWYFWRDARVTRTIDELVAVSTSGLPIVRPEVQLLYMAGSTDPKNQQDHDLARPTLDPQAEAWLDAAISTWRPGHPWVQGEGVSRT